MLLRDRIAKAIAPALGILVFPILVQAPSAFAADPLKCGIACGHYTDVPPADDHIEFGAADQPALDPQSIKIMVWNIKKGELPGLNVDLPHYGADRDLILIAEGFLAPDVKSIFDSFDGMRWDMGASFTISHRGGPAYATGTMIGSHVDPSYVHIQQTVDHEVGGTPKALTSAHYPIGKDGKQLLVISIHGINFVPLAALKRHLALAKSEIDGFDGPIIFGGDFNTNLASKVKYLMQMMAGLGFECIPFRNDQRIKTFGQTIDYIFIRGLHLKDSEVLGQLTSSDHKAMMAEFSLE